MADRWGIPDVHTDYQELCERGDLDGVTICTPNAAHAEQARYAFLMGRHVFCEKPLASTLADAEDMVRAARASGRIHMMAFTFRYGHAVRELRRRVREGEIGTPYYIRMRYDGWTGLQRGFRAAWRDDAREAGGGMLYDMGSHLFDMAIWLLGPIDLVTGFTHHIPRQAPHAETDEPTAVETDDLAAAWFRHSSGVRGEWFLSRITPPHGERAWVEVIGPEGALRASLSRGNIDRLERSHPDDPDWSRLPLHHGAESEETHCLGGMMRGFVDACIRGSIDPEVDATFEDGLAVQRALAAVERASQQPAWLPLETK